MLQGRRRRRPVTNWRPPCNWCAQPACQTARLQLAILCREPQPVLESFDSLAAMDREIEHFVNAIAPPDRPDSPTSSAPLRDLAALIAGQKASLASEKMTLVSGNSGPLFRETASDMPAPPSNTEADHSAIVDSGVDMVSSEYRPSGRLARILALAAIVLLVAGAVAWFIVVAM